MKASARPVARRYARALLEVSEGGAGAPKPPSPEALGTELRASVALLEASPELRRALADPVMPLARKRAVAKAVWDGAGASPLLARLVDLLVENGRAEWLSAIEEAYRQAWNARRGVVEAEAVSAADLLPEQRSGLTLALGRVSGKEVDLRTRKDPALIGGVLVRMAGKSYDGTVRGRLRALKARLVHGN